MMSLSVWLSAISEMTSDSAKTVHMLDMVSSLSHVRPRRLISAMSSSSVRAIISRKRPVPAAHLSFIMKPVTWPVSSRLMILLSCPPMSMIVRTAGFRKCAPRAWQVISVLVSVAKGMLFRP